MWPCNVRGLGGRLIRTDRWAQHRHEHRKVNGLRPHRLNKEPNEQLPEPIKITGSSKIRSISGFGGPPLQQRAPAACESLLRPPLAPACAGGRSFPQASKARTTAIGTNRGL